MSESASLQATPLLNLHRELQGKIVPFAGWSMPIQYAGVMEEHLCVRQKAGLFDVSHMGEVEVRGADALRFLQHVVTNDVSVLQDGDIQYSVMCYENGGVVDDLLIHRHNAEHFLLCVNASNAKKDFEWIAGQTCGYEVMVENVSDAYAQLALQGPEAQAILQPLTEVPLDNLGYYKFVMGEVAGIHCLLARTGYTGEDGFELYLEPDRAEEMFRGLLEAGKPRGIAPIGLGARDTLRLEMAYPLYGNELGADINPLEAGLGWVVKLKKEKGFVGSDALEQAKAKGLARRRVGLVLKGRGVPRSHYRILDQEKAVGEITSGTFSPSLNQGIALGFVPPDQTAVGSLFDIEIRNQSVPAEVVKLPFVPSRVKK